MFLMFGFGSKIPRGFAIFPLTRPVAASGRAARYPGGGANPGPNAVHSSHGKVYANRQRSPSRQQEPTLTDRRSHHRAPSGMEPVHPTAGRDHQPWARSAVAFLPIRFRPPCSLRRHGPLCTGQLRNRPPRLAQPCEVLGRPPSDPGLSARVLRLEYGHAAGTPHGVRQARPEAKLASLGTLSPLRTRLATLRSMEHGDRDRIRPELRLRAISTPTEPAQSGEASCLDRSLRGGRGSHAPSVDKSRKRHRLVVDGHPGWLPPRDPVERPGLALETANLAFGRTDFLDCLGCHHPLENRRSRG